MSYSRPN